MNRELMQHHPRTGRIFLPSTKTRVMHEGGGYLVATNAAGFRSDREFHTERSNGKRRILVFGDSFTAGEGVSNKHRYTDVLEAALGDTEIYNYGVPGTGTDQQYLIYDTFAKSVPCDMIVISVLVENIRRVAARFRPFKAPDGSIRLLSKPYFTLDKGQLVLHNVPVPSASFSREELDSEQRRHVDESGRFPLTRKVVNAMGLRDVAQRLISYQPFPQYDDPENADWKLMRAVMDRFIDECHAPVLLMPIPLYQHVEGTATANGYQARFREAAQAHGCHLHDPLPDLQAYSGKEKHAFRFESDIHPTPAGHAALAKSILPAVSRILDAAGTGSAGRFQDSRGIG